jgi:hypothetical protein
MVFTPYCPAKSKASHRYAYHCMANGFT